RKKAMRMWKSMSVAVGGLAIISLGSLPFGAAQESKRIEQMIAETKAPAHHEAISAYYEKEAQEAPPKQGVIESVGQVHAACCSIVAQYCSHCPLARSVRNANISAAVSSFHQAPASFSRC